jgi:hypothetical protein
MSEQELGGAVQPFGGYVTIGLGTSGKPTWKVSVPVVFDIDLDVVEARMRATQELALELAEELAESIGQAWPPPTPEPRRART